MIIKFYWKNLEIYKKYKNKKMEKNIYIKIKY